MKKIFLLFLIFLLLFSSLLIISNYNLKVFEDKGAKDFFGVYFSWLSSVGSNFVSFTGNAIKMDWFPENITKKVEGRK